MKVRLLVFAKAPQAGRVKTRLIPALGADGAARLARWLLDHTLTEARAAGLGPVELCTDPDPHHPAWAAFSPLPDLTLSPQGGGDLGARMARAARRGLESEAAVILLGTDCPALTRDRLCRIAAGLRRSAAVLVPALDGGYVALGLTRFHPSLFQDIVWGGADVAETTCRRLQRLGLPFRRLAPLPDIDRPADLRHLPTTWETPRCATPG